MKIVNAASADRKHSGPHHALVAVRFGAGVGDVVALAIQAQDEHGTAVQVAARLVGSDFGRSIALGRDVADALAEAAAAEFFGAAEKVDGVVGAVRREAGFHSAEMLVTKGKDVRPHDSGECSIRGARRRSW